MTNSRWQDTCGDRATIYVMARDGKTAVSVCSKHLSWALETQGPSAVWKTLSPFSSSSCHAPKRVVGRS